jgi:hypothetical protein
MPNVSGRVGRVGFWLFLTFHGLYALTTSGNALRVPDEFEVYFQTEHLADAGDLSVPQTLAIRQPVVVGGKVVGTQPILFGKIGRDGKPYAPYGPLAAVLALPHHVAGRALAAMAGVPRRQVPQGQTWVFIVGGVTMLTSATGAALAVAGFYHAALALGTSAPLALTLSLLLGGASVLWPYGTTLYSESWQAAAFVWAAALLLQARAGASRAAARVAVAALLLTVAGLTKVTSLVFAPAFVLAAVADRSLTVRGRAQVAAALAGGIVLAVAIHVVWNLSRFGAPFDFGYDWAETIPQPPPRTFLASDVARGLVVLLLTPGKSIFLWAPLLVLAAVDAPRFWREHRAVAIGLGAALLVGLVFYAAYLFPEGGYSHGPRNLVPIVPLLALAAGGVAARQWPWTAIAACAVVGLALAAPAVSVSFLEDQALGIGPNGQQRSTYYEIVPPAPGRPSNRYRVDYVPFVTATRAAGWLRTPSLGQGPDFFPLHLAQARRALPDGAMIPGWLIWGWVLGWLAVAAAGGGALWREWVSVKS